MSETQGAQTPSWRIDSWFPDIPPDQLKSLKIYFDEIMKFNRTLNLISPKTIQFADIIHFADSIFASRVIYKGDPSLKEIYDLGSGNGFPGLIFGILFPQVRVVLVDSDERKCEFLKHMVATLKLSNISILNINFEKMEPNSIQNCMARGLASISKAILLTRKIVRPNGVFYHVKSENWAAEVGEIPTQLCSVWTPALVSEYKLPVGSVRFAVVKTTKNQ